ncbi:MAG: hypothetical protein HY053_09195 [Proteobacteria bacterium]|nr:hypothetical protein [Pseudomonadota bacterium]
MQVMQRIADGVDFFKANWDWMAIVVGTISLYHVIVHPSPEVEREVERRVRERELAAQRRELEKQKFHRSPPVPDIPRRRFPAP